VSPTVDPPRPGCRAVGYAALVHRYGLRVLPHGCWTFVHDRHVYREVVQDGQEVRILPPARRPGPTDLDHLLFALRHEGVSLPIWRAWLDATDRAAARRQVEAAVRATPTGAYARRAWYLVEALTGERLDLPDVRQGNYAPLLDPRRYVTGPVRKQRRQRIDVNLLGDVAWSPVVRRTPEVTAIDAAGLRRRLGDIVSSCDEDLLRRAVSYLYTRETMASYEIEHERPPRSRAERFMALLRQAPEVERLDGAALRRLQAATVDPRFVDEGWRTEQVYVGEVLDLARQRIHYVAPRPEAVEELMTGLLTTAELLLADQGLDPIVAAGILSFAFVLVHPFSDGNGRLHRWLIHWALARRDVVPADLVLPVSAVMLSRRREYDEALETFSGPLRRLIDYDLDDAGRMAVHGDTTDLYRHPDLTRMVADLYRWLVLAVDEELPAELGFLAALAGAQGAVREIVDMPDRLVVLLIRLCWQHDGRLSARKRARHFPMLTDDEVTRLEEAVAEWRPKRYRPRP